MSLFITCPVESVERATAFYTALGWTLNAEMSDHNVSCFAIAPEQYVMLGSREMYASVGGVEQLVGGPDNPSKVTVSFDLGAARRSTSSPSAPAPPVGGSVTPTTTPSCTSASSTTSTATTTRRLDEAGRRSDRVSDLAAALDIVGARWALLVVERLLDGPQR